MGILSHGFGRFIDLTDVPSSYVGSAGKYLRVNTTASGIEFTSTTGNIFDTIEFNTGYAPTGSEPEGSIYWNSTLGALESVLTGGIVNVALGEQMYARVRNAEATTLNPGEVVYLFGASGNKATVKRASNTSDTTSSKTLGIVAESIAANQIGYVITQGVIDNLPGYVVNGDRH